MNENLVLIIVNLFITISSFFVFYIKLVERIAKLEVITTNLNEIILDLKKRVL